MEDTTERKGVVGEFYRIQRDTAWKGAFAEWLATEATSWKWGSKERRAAEQAFRAGWRFKATFNVLTGEKK